MCGRPLAFRQANVEFSGYAQGSAQIGSAAQRKCEALPHIRRHNRISIAEPFEAKDREGKNQTGVS